MVVNRDRVVVADTNIISYAFKRQPLAATYNRLLVGREVRVTFTTVAELHRWAEKDSWGSRRRLDLKLFLARFPMIPCTAGIPELFAKIIVDRQRAGRPMLRDDAWIAATAMYHDLPLATHDSNFLNTEGLRVISANPEIIALQTLSSGHKPLDMDMQCRCGY
jgi:predicted nucleic acid-binding protein